MQATRGLDLNAVRLLLRVVDHGSYTAASRATGVPKSTISQQIAALERDVGTGLLRRSSRSFSLTEAGTLLLPHARGIEELALEAEQLLLDRSTGLAGILRVATSPSLAQFAVAQLVSKFLTEHSEASIHLEAENGYIDLIGRGFDMGVREHAAALKDSTLLQRIVARTPWCLTAAPDWLARNPAPTAPAELADVSMLYFSTSLEAPSLLFNQGTDICEVKLAARMWSNDMAAIKVAAIESGGIAALPRYIVASALRSGLLVPVLEDWALPVTNVSILTTPRRQSSKLTKTFSDYLAAHLKQVTST